MTEGNSGLGWGHQRLHGQPGVGFRALVLLHRQHVIQGKETVEFSFVIAGDYGGQPSPFPVVGMF